MKKLLFFACALFSCAAGHATTQVFNLTTGNGAVGSPDAVWSVVMPNGASSAAIVSNGSIASGGVINSGTYGHDACGSWISPHTITTPGPTFGAIPSNGLGGNYVYSMSFNYTNSCAPSSAMINLIKAGADNNLTQIIVNGHVHAVAGVAFQPLSSLSQLIPGSEIVMGTNTISVVVNNGWNSYTGLMLCGNITIQDATPVIVAGQYCQGDPLTFDGSGSYGSIQSYGWEIAECDSTGTATGTNSWSNWYVGSNPGNFTFGDFIGFIPVCTHYYRITLALHNSCTDWVGTSEVIHLKCKPVMNVSEPPTVCSGTDVTLSVSGNAPSYTWGAPINQTANSVHVNATANYAYPVTATLNGCTATAYAHVTVAPQNFDVDLSTGVNNTTGGLISFGTYDDTWQLRGYPGYIASAPYTALRVIQPYSGTYGTWASSTTERWISTKSTMDGYGKPVEVAASQTDNSPFYNNDYYFETHFNLPYSGYNNLRIDITDVAVDNNLKLFLNSQVLTGTSNNLEYSLYSGFMPDSNFTMLHHPGAVATTASHYVTGTNTIIAEIQNGGGPDWNGSYMGMIMKAHVKGECVPPRGRSMDAVSDQDMLSERTEATTFVFPNPSAGKFTVRCEDQTILSIVVRDQLGRVVKTVEGLNASSAELSLDEARKGFYFLEIRYNGQQKPVYRKVIVE